MSDKCFWLIEYLTIISVQQHQSFYRQQITLTGMMEIGRILHTHKSFSYCWCERIIHKVRTVFQTYSLHHALHTHFFFTDYQYQTRYILRRRLYVDWTCMGTCMGVVLVILIPNQHISILTVTISFSISYWLREVSWGFSQNAIASSGLSHFATTFFSFVLFLLAFLPYILITFLISVLLLNSASSLFLQTS